MSNKQIITTTNAPAAIGTYSQAVKVGETVYVSGQIPLDADSMEIVAGGFAEQTHQVFKNLSAIAEASGGSLSNVVKLNIFMTDLSQFATLNTIMAEYFSSPYPARAAVQVSALPKAVMIEMDAVLAL